MAISVTLPGDQRLSASILPEQSLKTSFSGMIGFCAGADGKTPYIGENGNWWVGEEDTGVKAQGIQGEKGEKGDPGPQGEPGPAGANGKDGADGADGVGIKSVSQTTTSTADDGNNVITVTLTNGTKSTFKVQNGSKGSPGATPVKGTDYYTEADKAEMVSDVIAALPVYDGSVVSV